MLDIVLQNIAAGLVQQAEESVEGTNVSELHDMVVLLGLLEGLEDKIVSLQELLEDGLQTVSWAS